MYSILFNDYESNGRNGWKFVLKLLKKTNSTLLLDNYDDFFHEIDGFFSYEELKNIIESNNIITCRICCYKTKPKSINVINDLKEQNCFCAVYCTDQCYFEIYCDDPTFVSMALSEMVLSDVEGFEFNKKIFRTNFETIT